MSAAVSSCDHLMKVVELMSTVQTMHEYNQRVIAECRSSDDFCPSSDFTADVITTYMKYESEQQHHLGHVITDPQIRGQYTKLLSAYTEVLGQMDTLKRLTLRKTLVSAALEQGLKGEAGITEEALDKAFDDAATNVIAAAAEARDFVMSAAAAQATPVVALGHDEIPVAEVVSCTPAPSVRSVTAQQ
jgi:hypothetical protein